MRFFRLLASDLVKISAVLGKWLFLVSTPVLLIVVASYHQAGRSILEPLLGLAFVTMIFVVTHLISVKLEWPRSVGFGYGSPVSQSMAGPVFDEAEHRDSHFEQEIRQCEVTRVTALKSRQREAELWRQANPWGGYNPYE